MTPGRGRAPWARSPARPQRPALGRLRRDEPERHPDAGEDLPQGMGAGLVFVADDRAASNGGGRPPSTAIGWAQPTRIALMCASLLSSAWAKAGETGTIAERWARTSAATSGS